MNVKNTVTLKLTFILLRYFLPYDYCPRIWLHQYGLLWTFIHNTDLLLHVFICNQYNLGEAQKKIIHVNDIIR